MMVLKLNVPIANDKIGATTFNLEESTGFSSLVSSELLQCVAFVDVTPSENEHKMNSPDI
jgi:hypothetical protein